MGVKQCAECGESVDEAKAFCPSCGNAFVDEQQRAEPSNFDKLDGTMQFGQTMYNQMLSDMGLNLKAPKKPTVQTLKPAVETIKPVAPATTPAAKVDVPPAVEPEPKSRNRLIIAGIVAAFVILLLIVAALVGLAVWWRLG